MADDDLFSQLPVGSYEGVVFAVLDTVLETGSAAAFHKFPYRPGQKIELTGREPVTGHMTVAMFNSLTQFTGGGNNRMFPQAIQILRGKVQEQTLGKLVVPPFGTIDKAYVRLSEKYTALARNGCYVTLSFAEDNSDSISKGAVTVVQSMAELAQTADLELAAARVKLIMAVEDADSKSGTATDIISSVQAFNASLRAVDEDLSRPVRQAAAICSAIDDLLTTSTTLLNPSNWAALNALLAVRDVVSTSVGDTLKGTTPIKNYTLSGPMNVAGIAIATSNSVEDLLKLNVFADAYDVPAGETVVVYDRNDA